MGVFNYYGLAIIVLIMIPNIVYALTNKNGLSGVYHNKVVEMLEQVGRFGCFITMIVNIPYTYFGFWFSNALMVYLVVSGILVAMYLTIWVVCWKDSSVFKGLALSILPSVLFIFDGIMSLNIPLICFAVIFALMHILISYKNSAIR